MTTPTRRTALAWLAAPAASIVTPAWAQAPWAPSERITYVIGVAAGGTVDL
jgi:tripartite-type tricarboxylate transporter receptor subunit TctC